MPYAANGQISTSPIQGGIEITDQQYAEALAGMAAGELVSVDDGFAVIDPPALEEPSVPELEPPGYPVFTALQMLDLFTEVEQLTIVSATMSVPEIKLWYDKNLAADYVTYEDPRVDAGLQALVDAELLTLERKAEIVAAMQPPTT